MEFLTRIDREIFFIINTLPHTFFSDTIALGLSGIGEYGIGWFIIGIWLIYKEERKDHLFIVPLVGTAIASLTSSVFLKQVYARLRPTVEMGARIIDTMHYGYSFPSSHATVAFAFAYLLSNKEPRWRMGLYTIAVLVGVSRIYLGKHYPLDVCAGALLGLVIGWLVVTLYNRMHGKIKRTGTQNDAGRSRNSKSNKKKSHINNS